MRHEFGSDGGFSSSSTHEYMQHRQMLPAGAGAGAGGSSYAAGSHCYSNAYSYLPDGQHAAHAAMYLPLKAEEQNALQQPQMHMQMQPPQQQQQQQPKQKLPAHFAAKRFCLDLSDEALGSAPAAAAAAANGSS
jgi:hypothetical protein